MIDNILNELSFPGMSQVLVGLKSSDKAIAIGTIWKLQAPFRRKLRAIPAMISNCPSGSQLSLASSNFLALSSNNLQTSRYKFLVLISVPMDKSADLIVSLSLILTKSSALIATVASCCLPGLSFVWTTPSRTHSIISAASPAARAVATDEPVCASNFFKVVSLTSSYQLSTTTSCPGKMKLKSSASPTVSIIFPVAAAAPMRKLLGLLRWGYVLSENLPWSEAAQNINAWFFPFMAMCMALSKSALAVSMGGLIVQDIEIISAFSSVAY